MLLVFDGHDACGKTTLARAYASMICAEYVAPFHGLAGQVFAQYCVAGRWRNAARCAHEACTIAFVQAQAALVVVDRHWMTACSILPQRFYRSWMPTPLTVWCTAPVSVIQRRLQARGERETRQYTRYMDRKYAALYAQQRATCLKIDTSQYTIEACMAMIDTFLVDGIKVTA